MQPEGQALLGRQVHHQQYQYLSLCMVVVAAAT